MAKMRQQKTVVLPEAPRDIEDEKNAEVEANLVPSQSSVCLIESLRLKGHASCVLLVCSFVLDANYRSLYGIVELVTRNGRLITSACIVSSARLSESRRCK